MNPKLAIKTTLGARWRDKRYSNWPHPAPFDHWKQICAFASVKADPEALKKMKEGMAREQRIFAVMETSGPYDALLEFRRREASHFDAVERGELPLDAPFTDSIASVAAEFRQRQVTCREVLCRTIKETRPHVVKVLESLVPPISAARERLEKEEIAKANTWGHEFDPSEGLRILAAAEQNIPAFIEKLERDHPVGDVVVQSHILRASSPHRGLLRGILPPEMLD